MTNLLEPLADYLVPSFGNIYTRNEFGVIEAQPWTDDLREAVSCFACAADESLYVCAFNCLGIESAGKERSKLIQVATGEWWPWEIAFAFHEAAVILRPTPSELVKDAGKWSNEEEREDVALWLEAHLRPEQFRELAQEAWYRPEAWSRDFPEDIPYQLSKRLTPKQLLDVWKRLTGDAASDLSDAELQLLAPFVPPGRRHSDGRTRLEHARQAINGWRYQYATDCRWTWIPARYGNGRYLYTKRYLWRKDGVFERMLAGLRDKLEGSRLVEWLEKETGG